MWAVVVHDSFAPGSKPAKINLCPRQLLPNFMESPHGSRKKLKVKGPMLGAQEINRRDRTCKC